MSQPLIPLDAFPVGTHPGLYLREWLRRRRLTQTGLAALSGMTRHTINLIVTGNRGISADTAVALAEVFNVDASYWLTLHDNFRLRRAERRRQAGRKK